ncbi:hypothetical protein EJ02DRAFT_460989 [Clathrospora elynae]|uniref:Uncharacterized protein n=1 Tax=Clathrospora elynae TaxID=706981 RepID=A0A6A5S1W0_9PLEO|nr:hypothetical protein EJ02DRAFT_460989 [Clathrospora elynae]
MSACFNQQKQAGDQRAGVCYNLRITCCEKLFEALAAAISSNAQALKAVTICRMLLDSNRRLQSKVPEGQHASVVAWVKSVMEAKVTDMDGKITGNIIDLSDLEPAVLQSAHDVGKDLMDLVAR